MQPSDRQTSQLPQQGNPLAAKPAASPAPQSIAIYAAALAVLWAVLLVPSVAEGLPFGVNLPMAVVLCYGAFFLVMRGKGTLTITAGWFLFPINLLLALAFALFNVPFVAAINLLVLCVTLPNHFAMMAGANTLELSGARFIRQVSRQIFVRLFGFMGAGCSGTLAGVRKGAGRTALMVVAGAAVATPLLVVVAFLLTVADADYARMIRELLRRINLSTVFWLVTLAVVFFFPIISALYSFFLGKKLVDEPRETTARKGVEATPIYTVLALLNLLLLPFVWMQMQRLVGPSTLLVPPLAWEYARYAHEGFFPMVLAALICFGAQALCLCLIRKEGRMGALRVLITLLAAQLLVMMASAMKAILIYQGALGLSRPRVYVTITIVVLFIFLVLTLVQVWKKGFSLHKIGALVLLVALLALNYMNLDYSIAAYNVNLAQRTGHQLDQGYLMRDLSIDALPAYIHVTGEQAPASWNYGQSLHDKKLMRKELEEARGDVRLWNLGREAAWRALEAK